MLPKTIKLLKYSIWFTVLFLITGLYYLVKFVEQSFYNNDGVYPVFYIILGLGHIIIAYLLINSNRTGPEVFIDEHVIRFKTGIFSSSKNINWQDIFYIQLARYKVIFFFKNGDTEQLNIPHNKDLSIQTKDAIGEVAMLKNIEVGFYPPFFQNLQNK